MGQHKGNLVFDVNRPDFKNSNRRLAAIVLYATFAMSWVFVSSGGLESGLSAQEPTHSYRSFSTQITPSQLNQLLGSSNAVQKKIVSDKIAEMVKDKFRSLTPQQKQRLAEISSEFAQGNNNWSLTQKQEALERAISQDPELRRAAEQLRSDLRAEDFNSESIDRRQIERGIRDEVQQRLQRELGQYRGDGTGQSRNEPPSSNGSNGNRNRNDPSSNNGYSGDPFREPGRNNDSKGYRGGTYSPDARGNEQRDPFNGPGYSPGSSQNRSPNSNFNVTPPPRNNSTVGDDNPGFSGNDNRNGGSSANSLTPPSRGPYGGFSDDGKKQSSPGTSTDPSVASASGQDGKLPKESVGHKFNRMLLNSFEKAMEKKIGSDTPGGEQSFSRVLNKFVDSMSKSNPQLTSAFGSGGNGLLTRIDNGLRNSRNRIRASMPSWNSLGNGGPSFGGGGLGMSLPALSVRGVVTVLLVLGLIVGAIIFAIKKTPLAHYLGLQQPVPGPGPAPEIEARIQDYDEVVALVDRFTLWLFGRKADWWHSKRIQAEVARLSPEIVHEIKAMMRFYDEARYARPGQPLSPQKVAQIKTVLGRLKELAQDQSRKVRQEHLTPSNPPNLHTA